MLKRIGVQHPDIAYELIKSGVRDGTTTALRVNRLLSVAFAALRSDLSVHPRPRAEHYRLVFGSCITAAPSKRCFFRVRRKRIR